MASSGSFLTNGWYSSSKGDYVYLEFAWSVSATSIANNTKTIYWELRGKRTASGFVNAGGFQVVIDGDTVYNKSTDYRIELRNGTVVASGTKTLTHNTDGTRSFAVSIRGAIYTYAVNCTANNEKSPFILDTIPRQATLTAAPNFTDLDNPTITYSNPAGNAVTDLKACISFTGAKDDIAYRNISKTGSTYQFPLTAAERDVLRNNTGIDRDVIFYVRTIIGSVTYYSTLKRKLTIAESDATKPTVDMTVTLNNGNLSSAFDGLYIQGKSKVDVSLSAGGKYGATIQSYSAVVDGKTYNSKTFTSDVVQNPGSIKIVGYAKDSRKFTGSDEQTINVIEYSKPLVIPLSSENAIQCYRSDGNGNKVGNSTSLWIKAKRSYHSVNGKNKCALQWRAKPASEEWSSSHIWRMLLDANGTTDEYNAQVEGTFDLSKAYTVQINAIDLFGETDTHTFEIPTRDVALHLGKGGKNVAIGTYCDYSEERTFYSGWKAIFDKDVIAKNIILGDSGLPIVNHVVEEGTDGIWTYRKWADGKAECWCSKAYAGDTDDTWGSLYGLVCDPPNYPNIFTEAPLTNKDIAQNTGNSCWLSGWSAASITNPGRFALLRPTFASLDVTVNFFAIGRWK